MIRVKTVACDVVENVDHDDQREGGAFTITPLSEWFPLFGLIYAGIANGVWLVIVDTDVDIQVVIVMLSSAVSLLPACCRGQSSLLPVSWVNSCCCCRRNRHRIQWLLFSSFCSLVFCLITISIVIFHPSTRRLCHCHRFRTHLCYHVILPYLIYNTSQAQCRVISNNGWCSVAGEQN